MKKFINILIVCIFIFANNMIMAKENNTPSLLQNIISNKPLSNEDYINIKDQSEKACYRRNFNQCFQAGYLYYNGLGVKQDYNQAEQLFQKACNGGETVACIFLGDMYYLGEGVNQDYSKTVNLWGKACNHGYMSACNTLGDIYFNEKSIKNYYKAARFWRISCKNENPLGCLNLGNLYLEGEGVPQSNYMANKFYQKACDLRAQKACDKLKELNFKK